MEGKTLREVLLEAQIALGEAISKLGSSDSGQRESGQDQPVRSTSGSTGTSIAGVDLSGIDIERVVAARRGGSAGALAGADAGRLGINIACDEGCAAPASLGLEARSIR